MYVAFEDMPPAARIWVYQADRAFSGQEAKIINDHGRNFLHQWAAHGTPLQASLCTLHQHFVIFAVNNEAHLPSGCSIDQSVSFVKSLEDQLGISFFDRSKVAFWQQNEVVLIPLDIVKRRIIDGEISSKALIFNNLIQTRSEMEHWITPVGNSWLARYFTQTAGN